MTVMSSIRSVFTRGQVGAANVPEEHRTVTAPAVQADVDYGGDGYGGAAHPAVSGGLRGFRAPNGLTVLSVVATGAVLSGTPVVNPDTLADVHYGLGSPDRRRTDEELRGNARGEIGFSSAPELYSNERRQVQINPEAAPERPRQGFTGADPYRVTTYIRPAVMRAFDKNAAEHAGAVDKVGLPQPTARTSRNFPDVTAPRAYAGGYTDTRRRGIGAQRQTFRVVPASWGETLVVDDGPNDNALAAAAGQVRRGFRAG